jgi:hypothetical protein
MLNLDPSLTIAEYSRLLAQYYEDQKIAKAEKTSTNCSIANVPDVDTVNLRSQKHLELEIESPDITSTMPKNTSFESKFSRALDIDFAKIDSIFAKANSEGMRQEDFENSVDSMTTTSGLRVDTVSSCKDRRVQATVTVTRANGQSVSFETDDNVRINEREDGALSVTFAKTGEIRVYAADGSMTSEQGEPCEPGSYWSGTSGDDVILVLSPGSRVGAGDGNDAIMILANAREIDGGDGNDLIVGGRAIWTSSTSIFGHTGNDTLQGENYSFENFDMGDGDNVISINRSGKDGKVGNGNNTITIDKMYYSSFTIGNGNNTIAIDKVNSSNINIGDGNNNILINSYIGHPAPGYDFNTLTVGNGDNTMTFSEYINSPLRIGNGNNTITVGDFSGSNLQAGNGDNDFILRYISGWRPYNV